jgi:hypothetical protein
VNLKNKYVKYSKISEDKFRLFIRYFVEDLSATQISNLLGISRNSINRYFFELRNRINTYCLTDTTYRLHNNQSTFINRNVYNGDNSSKLYVGVRIIQKMIYTEIIPLDYVDIVQVIHDHDVGVERINLPYDVFVDFNGDKQTIVNYQTDNNMHLIRGFWSFMKFRLAKFHGIDKKYFDLHLKECEFRFNNRGGDIYKLLLKLVRQDPI